MHTCVPAGPENEHTACPRHLMLQHHAGAPVPAASISHRSSHHPQIPDPPPTGNHPFAFALVARTTGWQWFVHWLAGPMTPAHIGQPESTSLLDSPVAPRHQPWALRRCGSVLDDTAPECRDKASIGV